MHIFCLLCSFIPAKFLIFRVFPACFPATISEYLHTFLYKKFSTRTFHPHYPILVQMAQNSQQVALKWHFLMPQLTSISRIENHVTKTLYLSPKTFSAKWKWFLRFVLGISAAISFSCIFSIIIHQIRKNTRFTRKKHEEKKCDDQETAKVRKKSRKSTAKHDNHDNEKKNLSESAVPNYIHNH